MSTYGTNYMESEAVLAAVQGDQETLERIVGEMLDGELRGFKNSLHEVIAAVEDEQMRRDRERRRQG